MKLISADIKNRTTKCLLEVNLNGMETALQVRKSFDEDLNVSVSLCTGQRALRHKGLTPFFKSTKPHLSQTNNKARLRWVMKHDRLKTRNLVR